MNRRRPGIFCALALAMCVVASVMWVLSHATNLGAVTYTHRAAAPSNGWFAQLGSERGRVQWLLYWRSGGQPGGFGLGRQYSGFDSDNPFGTKWRGAGFAYAYLGSSVWDGDMGYAPYLEIIVPYWFLVAMFAVLPIRWLFIHRRHKNGPPGFTPVLAAGAPTPEGTHGLEARATGGNPRPCPA